MNQEDINKIFKFFQQMIDRLESMDRKMDKAARVKNALDGDQLLDNHDMCMLLGVTKRSLQRYRQMKKVSYYKLDGKTYYKASEVQEFLKKYGKS